MDWVVVEVAIGVSFFFFALSVLASSVNEAIASVFALRARNLEAALVRMLGATHARALLDTPLVASLRKRPSRGPSYLAPATFSAALHEIIGHRSAGYALDLARVELVELRSTLARLAANVGDDANRFRSEVEAWFDETMNRASGWYKRRTQAILFVIGLAVAAGANLSALSVAQRLWDDSALRASVSAQAQAVSGAGSASGAAATAPNVQQLRDLGIPGGWDEASRPRGWEWPAALAGWLATAFAVSLGAPFWFDLLGKAVNLRGSGTKPGSATPPDAPPPPLATAPDGDSAPPALPVTVAVQQRALVVASATSISGRENLAWLYAALDALGPAVVDQELGGTYGSIHSLTGAEVTRAGLMDALRDAAVGHDVVDLILMVHGEPDALVLGAPGGHGTQEVRAVDLVADAVGIPGLAGKLRLCYSTACYGLSHAPAFIAAGFRTVIGARGVNANSATELPLLLRSWARGEPIGRALAEADNEALRAVADGLARTVGHFPEADSTKVLVGDARIAIDVNA